jgi:hypothetical protein
MNENSKVSTIDKHNIIIPKQSIEDKLDILIEGVNKINTLLEFIISLEYPGGINTYDTPFKLRQKANNLIQKEYK